MHRFYVSDLATATPEVVDAEAHHLRNVLRLKAGDAVELFDGRGVSASAVIDVVRRDRVLTKVRSTTRHERGSAATLTVAAAPPKGDRLKWMIEKLTELGVGRLIPLQTERTVVTPREARLERLQSTVVAACKQSGRSWLMELSGLQSIGEVISHGREGDIVIAHPALPDSALPDSASPAADRPCTLLIGPEGGFTDDELQAAADAGAGGIAWPGTILRTETAAVALAAVLLSRRQ